MAALFLLQNAAFQQKKQRRHMRSSGLPPCQPVYQYSISHVLKKSLSAPSIIICRNPNNTRLQYPVRVLSLKNKAGEKFFSPACVTFNMYALCKLSLSSLYKCCEALCIADGKISQHLSVDLHLSHLKAVHEL